MHYQSGLDACRVLVLRPVPEPHLERRVGESRMVPIDRAHVQRFALSRWSRKNVQRQPAVDPRRVVTHEQEIRQWPQDIVEPIGDEIRVQVIDAPCRELTLEDTTEEHLDEPISRCVGER